MTYAIHVFFDHKTDVLIRNIWATLAKENLETYMHESRNKPHLTLAIIEDLNVKIAQKALIKFCESRSALPITFAQIGFFPRPGKVVFWAPVVTNELLLFHNEVIEIFRFCDSQKSTYYQPGKWTPHCSLALEIEDQKSIPQIIEICSTLPTPHEAMITEIGLISFRPVKHICACPLSAKVTG